MKPRLHFMLKTASAAVAVAAMLAGTSVVHAQTLVTLDGTSGSNSISTSYSTTGGLTFNLGFFVDYLVVGGGGGPGGGISGQAYDGGGGGGAVLGGTQSLSAISYAVTVGAGGGSATNGGASAAFGFTANGGTRGGAAGAAVGGASGSGFSGGARSGFEAGGGGGAGGDGSAGSSSPRRGGDGGIGVTSSITGVATGYGGGGGGGGGGEGSGNGRDGGGGRNGAPRANSGGGGGASGVGATASIGAAGTVIVRYAGPSLGAIGGTVSSGTGSATGTTLHTFTTVGSTNFNLSGVEFNTRLGTVLTTGIGGTGNLDFAGPGRLTLAADSSYIGDTVVSGGTLQVGNGGSGGTLGNGSVMNNSLLVFDRTDALAVSNAISGTGSLVQQGSGTLSLAAANTFTGSSRIAAGTLALGHVSALSGSTLDLAGGDLGAVNFAVAGTDTYTLGGLQGSRNLANGGNSLVVGGNDSSTAYSGVLSGAGNLTKTGDGVLTLLGNNSYSGTTTISAGTLRINGDQSAAGGAVTVASGGSLAGSGMLGGATTIQSGGTLSPGNSPGTLTIAGDLTWNGGANYNWQLLDARGTAGSTSGWDLVNVGGTLDIQATSSTPFNLNLWTLASTSPDVSGQAANFDRTSSHAWTLASATGGIQNFSTDKFTINTGATNGTGGFANDTAGGVFAVTTAGNDLRLEFTPGGQQFLNATASALTTSQHYTTDNGGLTINLALPVDLLVVGGGGGSGANASGETYQGGGGGGQVRTATGLQATEATAAVTIGSGGSSGGGGVGTAGGATSAFDITAVGGGGGGSNGVRSGGNSGSGFTGGAGAPSSIDAGGGAGDLQNGFAGTSSPRKGGDGGAGFVSDITGTEQMYGFGGAGTSSSSGVNGDGTSTAPRTNSGGGGRGGNGAAGVVVVRYEGAQVATGGTVTTDGGDTIHTFTGSGSFVLGNSVRATLSGVVGGSGDFTFSGPGTLSLTAANTYAGETIITAGTLQVGDGGETGTLGGGAVVNNGSLVFDRSNGAAAANAISGSGSLTQQGAGTLTLSGANTYGGGTTLSAGALRLQNAGGLGSGLLTQTSGDSTLVIDVAGTVTNTMSVFKVSYLQDATLSGNLTLNNATFDVASGVSATNSGVLSGSGGLTRTGAGTLVLTGNNTYSGATTISDGTLQVGAGGTSGTLGGGAVVNNSSLVFDRSDAVTVANAISGSGGLVQSGSGRLTLSGTNTYTGTTTVSAGELNVNGSIAGSAVTVQTNASLSGSGTVGVISGAGSVDPGNSPGILISPAVDPTGGLSFNFEFTGLNPTYSNASASVNDVLRLTDAKPFVASLTSANAVNIYFNVATFEAGQFYTGGFFTDVASDFLNQLVDATFNYYVSDADGSVSYGGENYRALGEGLSITLSTVRASGDFAGGTVNGQVMQFEVVPEPSTYALLMLAAAGLAAHTWRQRRRRSGN